jgi:hypothetical protein
MKKDKNMTTEEAQAFFWHSIEKSNKCGNSDWRKYNVDKHIDALTKLLSKSSKEQLIQFEN